MKKVYDWYEIRICNGKVFRRSTLEEALALGDALRRHGDHGVLEGVVEGAEWHDMIRQF